MTANEGAEPATPAGSPTKTGGGKFGAGALAATALVALIVGAGGGYAIGNSEGQDSGKQTGIAKGKELEAAKYEPGKPAYRAIYHAGRVVGAKRGERRGERRGDKRGLRAGAVVGFQKGEKVGVTKGQQEGAVVGATAALGGLTSWENGALYIVTTGPGTGVPTAITQRHQMVPGTDYRLCEKNPQKLCEAPVDPLQ